MTHTNDNHPHYYQQTALNTPQNQAYDYSYNNYYPYAQNQQTYLQGWVDYRNPAYIKGAVVGAALTLLITNPTIKKALVKGVVGIWGTMQGGVEELKEQIRDVQAEKGTEQDV